MRKANVFQLCVIPYAILMFVGCSKEDPAPASSATPTTGIVANITPNSASIQVSLSIAGTFTIDSKGVCWSLKQSPTTSDSKTNDGPGPGNFTSQLTGLSSNSTYFIRSYVTGSGKTTYGNEISFKTLESLTVTLTTNAVTSIAVASANSGGSMTTTGIGSIIAKGIVWSKAQNPTIADSKTSNGTGTTSFSSALINLEGNTVYNVRAYATDKNNATTYGNQVSFTTLQPFTVAVQTSSISAVTTITATSGGTITATGTGNVTTRGVCWNTATNPTIANTKATSGSATGIFTANLTGLTADTQYFVRAYATDNNNVTVYGNEISFTTTVLTLDGLWIRSGSSNVLRINGSTSSWETYSPSDVAQAAINLGLMTLTTPLFRNITKSTSTKWTCENFIISFQSGTTTINKAAYVNATITITNNGNSFTVSGTIPSGAGWPSGQPDRLQRRR